jgi:YggT family protein
VVGGLAVHSFAGFLITEVSRAAFAAQAGPRGLVRLLVSWTFALLRLGVLVRVLGSWFQQGRWSPWTRWAYALTDWFMVPLARVIPNLGMFDISPIVAYFGLGLLQGLVLGAL